MSVEFHRVDIGLTLINEIYFSEIDAYPYQTQGNVLSFLEDWCFMNLSHTFSADVEPTLLAFRFIDRHEAIRFKLIWA